MAKFEIHDFYCLNCGQKTIPLARKIGQKRESGHRKKLYCPFCRMEVNTYECNSYEDMLDFQEKFKEGLFKEEALESILKCN